MADIDYRLRDQVSTVQNMVIQVSQTLDMVGRQVDQVGREQSEARSELAQLRHDFDVFVRSAQLTANVQRAETKVAALQGQLEIEFGHHKIVRRTAVGMLQSFDVGLVSQETVHAVGEQLMMQTPRYWLAPVLVALAAWAGDDRELCDRAVQEAFRRSPSRTSLFMALILRRQGRHQTAVRWLRHYLKAQDPTALGRDFAVVLEATAQGAFGPAGVELLRETLDRWQEELRRDPAVQAAQVVRWRAEVDAFIAGPADAAFPVLAASSAQWPQLRQAMSCAQAHAPLAAKYRALLEQEVIVSDRLEDAIDDILDRLVSEYDVEELPLRRDLAFNKEVIATGGDEDLSRRNMAVLGGALEAKLDYLTIQSESALNPAGLGVSASTQRVAVAACTDWFGRAHAEFTRDYRMLPPQVVEVTLGANHNVGASGLQLPPWTGSFARPMPELEQELSAHWDDHGRAYIDGFAFKQSKIVVAGSVTFGLLVMVSLCTQNIGFGFLAALLCGGIWAAVLYSQAQQAQQNQQKAREYVEACKRDSLAQLRGARAELDDWISRYRAADADEAAMRTLIGELATAGAGATPHERRVVDTKGWE